MPVENPVTEPDKPQQAEADERLAALARAEKIRQLQQARPNVHDMAMQSIEDGTQVLEPQTENKELKQYREQRAASVVDDREDGVKDTFYQRPPQRALTSSYLRPGARFVGNQQSGRSTYQVEVELKDVDIENAFLCGFLKIEGLTEDHPTLITYFEGEMVSDKYSFRTRHSDWGATIESDRSHWRRFRPWREVDEKASEELGFYGKNFHQNNHVFMRWKECFLVPDHRIHEVQGASYAGFYYICFDQVHGSVSGFYYHEQWDKYQQLELSHVPKDDGFQTFEFR